MTPPPRILIVEDDEIIASLIGIMLEKKGYAIAGKTGYGEQAVVMAAEREPDLILMDINLAGSMDGVAASVYIFQFFRGAVVFLTAFCDDLLLERAKNAQPLGYILKPFTDRDLGSNVELALHNHRIRKKYLDLYPVGEPKKIMASPDPLLITDSPGRIIFCNPAALRFLELPAEQVLMHDWRGLMTVVSDRTGEEIPDPVREAATQMPAAPRELIAAIVTGSGRKRAVSIAIRPVRDDRQELTGVLIQVREKP